MNIEIVILLSYILISIYALADNNSKANKSNEIISYDIKRGENNNYYPYQEGFPVELGDYASQMPLSTFSLYGHAEIESRFRKGIFIGFLNPFIWEGEVRVYNQRGEVIGLPDYSAGPPAYVGNNFDGVDEIIADQYCPVPWDSYGLGATVKKLYGWTLNGFPNLPITGFVSPSIEDVDRDGNYEIVFSTYYFNRPDIEIVGAFILVSWRGVFPGFPVLFPLWYPDILGAGDLRVITPIGDYDDDGLMEI